jgi:hypothetical protein
MGGVCRSHENTKLFCRKDFGILRGPGISPHGYQGTTIWVLTSARSKQPTHNGQRSVQAQIPSVQASGPPESTGSGSFFWTHQSALWWLHLLKDSSRYDHTAVGITSMHDRVHGWLSITKRETISLQKPQLPCLLHHPYYVHLKEHKAGLCAEWPRWAHEPTTGQKEQLAAHNSCGYPWSYRAAARGGQRGCRKLPVLSEVT